MCLQGELCDKYGIISRDCFGTECIIVPWSLAVFTTNVFVYYASLGVYYSTIFTPPKLVIV